MLITFSGVDGAGKTTQLELLVGALSKTERVASIWYRPGYSGRLQSIKDLLRGRRPGRHPASSNAQPPVDTLTRPSVRRVWIVVALVDALIEWGVRVRWLRRRIDRVIYDRYVDDGILDLEFRFPELDVTRWWLTRVVRKCAPRPDLQIMLLLSWEETLQRIEEKDEPFPDPLETRRKRFDAYRALADTGRYRVIDASGTPVEVHHRVLDAVRSARV
jgi:dTMP kinase